jgi:hypothetical protein
MESMGTVFPCVREDGGIDIYLPTIWGVVTGKNIFKN